MCNRTHKEVPESGSHGERIARQDHRGKTQGSPLPPLLANIYLNEYDKEMVSRGVPVIQYTDYIVVLAKSSRLASLCGEQLSKRLLAHGEERTCATGNLKQKTRTGGMLQHPGPVRVSTLMRLNRRVSNGTHGGEVGGYSINE